MTTPTPGRNTYKGINAQSWAAMSLFLQFSRDSRFDRIEMEAPHFQDFNLIFQDRHKIICESKDYARNFNFTDLKLLLESLTKKDVVKANDEILIICSHVNKELSDMLGNIRYWSDFLAREFKRRKFDDKSLKLLPKVRLWKIPEKDNHLIVYSLFRELINFWIPQEDLEAKVDSILIKKIYEGSAKGSTYKRADILEEIESFKISTEKKSGVFDKERVALEKQYRNILQAIKNNKSPMWADGQLASLSTRPSLVFFLSEKFKGKKIDDLSKWSDVWRLKGIHSFSFSLMDIFENNIHIQRNRAYIIKFIRENVGKVRGFYRHDYFNTDVVKILTKIIDTDRTLLRDSFEIVKSLLAFKKKSILFINPDQNDEWENEQILGLLEKIYSFADRKLKNEIVFFIFKNFDLIDEQNWLTRKVYSEYSIIEKYIREGKNFEEHFKTTVKELLRQHKTSDLYRDSKTGKSRFEGYEWIGGGISQTGSHFSANDRFFVETILRPALDFYYSQNPKKAFKFVNTFCLWRPDGKEIEINADHPDFLLRSSLGILFNEYKKNNPKAKKIFIDFLKIMKGLPSKDEVIFERIAKDKDLSDEQKWYLVDAQLKLPRYKKFPANVFVSQIIGELVARDYLPSVEVFIRLIKDENYYTRIWRSDSVVTDMLNQILESNPQKGLLGFQNYIDTEFFRTKMETFNAYEVSNLLNKILNNQDLHSKGLILLKKIISKEKLTTNEQILISSGLINATANSEAENADVLMSIYKNFLWPLLQSRLKGDLKRNYRDKEFGRIYEYLPLNGARESFVQFADRLTKQKKIAEALTIIRIFINDPDPFTPLGVDPQDSEGKYDEHKKIIEKGGDSVSAITTVRGWCGWVLLGCSGIEGREFIKELISLSQQLITDDNLFVSTYGANALSGLVRNRLTVLPEDKSILFFGSTTEEALKNAKAVEKIAFEYLDRISKMPTNIQDAMSDSLLHLLDPIRAISEKDAKRIVLTLMSMNGKVVGEAAPLFIYFAEFRGHYFKNWKWSLPGLYDDLINYDNSEFIKILELAMKKNENARIHFAWQFFHMPKESVPDETKGEDLFRYSEAMRIALKYLNQLTDEYNHETFSRIYLFLEDNFKGKFFEECYVLWKKCLEKEKEFYDNLIATKQFEAKLKDIYWWPYFENGKILQLVEERKGIKNFLEDFDYLASFPKELLLGDFKALIPLLTKEAKTNKIVRDIFDRLIQREDRDSIAFFEAKNKWLK
jgi:hypothetical protein